MKYKVLKSHLSILLFLFCCPVFLILLCYIFHTGHLQLRRLRIGVMSGMNVSCIKSKLHDVAITTLGFPTRVYPRVDILFKYRCNDVQFVSGVSTRDFLEGMQAVTSVTSLPG